MYHKTWADKRFLLSKPSKRFPTEHGIGICTYPLSKEVQRSIFIGDLLPVDTTALTGVTGIACAEIGGNGEIAHHSGNLLPILRVLTFHLRLHMYILLPTPFSFSPSWGDDRKPHLRRGLGSYVSQPFFLFSGRLKLCSCQLVKRVRQNLHKWDLA